jgi:hypothetical protein
MNPYPRVVDYQIFCIISAEYARDKVTPCALTVAESLLLLQFFYRTLLTAHTIILLLLFFPMIIGVGLRRLKRPLDKRKLISAVFPPYQYHARRDRRPAKIKTPSSHFNGDTRQLAL